MFFTASDMCMMKSMMMCRRLPAARLIRHAFAPAAVRRRVAG
jgi:hypothetical protein